MFFDRIALGNHKYTATRAGRIRHSEHWILKLNLIGPQQPLNQRLGKQPLDDKKFGFLAFFTV